MFRLLAVILLLSCFNNISCCPDEDLCKNMPCQNGSYCDDGVCICPCGYSGTNCEILSHCGSVPANQAIYPILQQQPTWCWLSCGEMIFRYYSIPQVNPTSYQCGIIGSLYSQCYYDCTNCAYVGGTMQDVQAMLNLYPKIACSSNSCAYIKSIIKLSALSVQELIIELDHKRPILAGISVGEVISFTPQHAVLIIGYQYDLNGNLWLSVNDPWPYIPFGIDNPYLSLGGNSNINGNYNIPYSIFSSNLNWTQSLYGITL